MTGEVELSRFAIDGRLDGSGCLEGFSDTGSSGAGSVGTVLLRFLVDARLF